jgi:nucleoside-diphosphate-sugar epimerase
LSYTIEDKEIKLELGMNIDKAMKCIGWKPIISMEQTIADTID